jgi:hypothetical protein
MVKLVKSLKEMTGNNHAHLFTQLFNSIERRISFNPRWATDADQSDLSKMIFDEQERLILAPGEMLACSYERKNSQHNRRSSSNPARNVLHSPVVVFGTPYGPACMHTYRPNHHKASTSQLASALMAVDTGEIHMTDPLAHAIMAILERKPEMLALITDPKVRKNISLQTFAKFFLLTEDFMKEIDEQAEFDREAGKTVSDGFPPLVPKTPRANIDRRQKGRKVFTKGEKIVERRHQQEPRRKATVAETVAAVPPESAPFEDPGLSVPDERLLSIGRFGGDFDGVSWATSVPNDVSA